MSPAPRAEKPPCAPSKSPTKSGVNPMPKRLEAVAAQSAAGTLPRAIEVKAIDDWTVEGRAQSRITPVQSGGVKSPGNSTRAPRPSAGNSMNVEAMITTCSRQCHAPAKAACGESRAPCRKNRRAMAASVAYLATTAPLPCAGQTVATPTMPTIAAI